jgi:drug/metabolite transporter (DMT)-like permease
VNSPRALTLLTVLLWSTGATLGRLISLHSSFPLFVLAFTCTLLTLAVWSARTDSHSWRAKLGAVVPSYLLFGSLGYLLYWVGVTESYRAYGSVAEPIVLNYMWPIFTAVFTESFFRVRVAAKPRAVYAVEIAGLSLAFLSTLVMVTRGSLMSLQIPNASGLCWGLFGAACYGLFSAYSGTVPREQQLIFLMSSAAVGIAGMVLLSLWQLETVTRVSFTDLLVVVTLGAGIDGLGYVIWTRVNRLVSQSGAGIASVTSLVYLLPMTSLCVASVAFREATVLRPYFLVVVALLAAGSWLCGQGVALVTARYAPSRNVSE